MHEHEKRLEALLAAKTEAPRRAGASWPCRPRRCSAAVRRAPGDVARVAGRDARRLPAQRGRRPQGVPILRVARIEATRAATGSAWSGRTVPARPRSCARSRASCRRSRASCAWGPTSSRATWPRSATRPSPAPRSWMRSWPRRRVEKGPARSYLARFLFRGEDVFKPVAELSGGERSRLELALLGITPANLLLLDEPTNHLDIPAREALETFLRSSESTMLIVSHDRRLLEIGLRQPVGRRAGRGHGTRPDRGLRRRLHGLARSGRRRLDGRRGTRPRTHRPAGRWRPGRGGRAGPHGRSAPQASGEASPGRSGRTRRIGHTRQAAARHASRRSPRTRTSGRWGVSRRT